MTNSDDMRAYVIRKGGARLTEMAKELNIPWGDALKYLELIQRQGIIVTPDKTGFRALAKTHHHNQSDQKNSDQRDFHNNLPENFSYEQIMEMHAQIKKLKESGRILIRQRDSWKERALAAEAKLAGEASSEGNDGGRYAALKRLLARELHPDFAAGDGLEKIIREAVFKKLWPLVESIDKNSKNSTL